MRHFEKLFLNLSFTELMPENPELYGSIVHPKPEAINKSNLSNFSSLLYIYTEKNLYRFSVRLRN